LLLVGSKNDIVTERCDWHGQNGVCFAMVYNDEANVALEGHEGKGSGENDVQDLCLFVHKGSKAENIRI
jgi:hypothetical protein